MHTIILGFDWSGWRVLIESEINIATGMVWLVCSDKWKVPWVYYSMREMFVNEFILNSSTCITIPKNNENEI